MGPCATLLLFPFYQSEVGSEDLGRMHCPLVPSCLYLTCLNSQAGCQCVITPFILFFTPCDPLSAALSFRNDNGICSERVALISTLFCLFKIIIILVPFKKLNRTGWGGGNIQTRLGFLKKIINSFQIRLLKLNFIPLGMGWDGYLKKSPPLSSLLPSAKHEIDFYVAMCKI